MEPYIAGNKEAWEEAFDLRDAAYGANIKERISNEAYAFFNQETAEALKRYDLSGKNIGQFCCNNGRELLSLVKSTGAASGTGFDIAENMVRFANDAAETLGLPCAFVAKNVLDVGDAYRERFDFVLITIGALCWFRDLSAFFAVVANCMKPGAAILINEQHPFINMLATEDDAEFDARFPTNCAFSYFEHEWISNEGMHYVAGKSYASKTFTDYTHPLSDIIGAMCENGMTVTGMQEFDCDISDNFPALSGKGYPLSMILEGRKK